MPHQRPNCWMSHVRINGHIIYAWKWEERKNNREFQSQIFIILTTIAARHSHSRPFAFEIQFRLSFGSACYEARVRCMLTLCVICYCVGYTIIWFDLIKNSCVAASVHRCLLNTENWRCQPGMANRTGQNDWTRTQTVKWNWLVFIRLCVSW